MSFNHETVLLHETIDALNVQSNGNYVDCTLGGAGHARYILSQLNDKGHLFAFDQDSEAIEHAQNHLANELQSKKLTLIHSNFKNIKEKLAEYGVTVVNGIYYDLGVSSPQFDHDSRGFSYRHEAKLDMRMDQTNPLTAHTIVNEWSFNELVKIITSYGEERFAKRIARAIEQIRMKETIETTTELADIVKNAIPAATRRTGGHPAKRTFQALRIAVNDELSAVEKSIRDGLDLLAPGGRMSVISFHSLEDRIVKNIFKEKTKNQEVPANFPIRDLDEKTGFKLITRKPVVASKSELEHNRRARSAKLRVIEKTK